MLFVFPPSRHVRLCIIQYYRVNLPPDQLGARWRWKNLSMFLAPLCRRCHQGFTQAHLPAGVRLPLRQE